MTRRPSIASTVPLLFVTALLLALVPAGAWSAPAEGTVHVIVQLDETHAPGDHAANKRGAADVARQHGIEPTHTYGSALFGFAAAVPEGRLAALRNDPRVVRIERDRTVYALAEEPTGIRRIDAASDTSDAHAKGYTGSGVTVAIIDTGIDSDHPDLVDNLDLENDLDCVNNDDNAEDDHGHGTHVAGTVAAVDNGIGVVGVAPAATLVGVKVLGSNGSGSWATVACGVDHVTALKSELTGPVVANMSLGGSSSEDPSTCASSTLHQALCNSVAAGVTHAVAAGNDSADASGYVPAKYPEVITVSAFSDTNGDESDAGCSGFALWTTCDEDLATFSNYGSIVDVVAPGVSISSTTYDGSYGSKSGTSMASPHVAGVAALALGVDGTLTPAEVAALLRDSGQCPNDAQNSGLDDCSGQGSWNGDPDEYVEPMANAVWAAEAATSGATPLTDLAITSVDAPTSAAPLDPVSVTVNVENQGNQAVSDVTITYSAPDGGTLSKTRDTVSLAAGATTQLTFDWTAPSSTGDYTVGASHALNDDDTSDDSASDTITVEQATTMHVADLAGASINHGSSWTPSVIITVHDANGALVDGATVTGTWSDRASGTQTCVTTDGTCRITDDERFHKNVSSVTFTVDKVEREGLSYDSVSNLETSIAVMKS